MTQDNTKLKELLERVQSLPEDAELPEDLLNDLDQGQILQLYVVKMMMDKGVEITDGEREKLASELEDEITKQQILAMPDYLVKELNEKLDAGAADEEIEKAIDESGIDVETITEQTMTAFREKYLNGEEK
ncbi:hypothetical protein IJ768_00340 [Candidatus Saccharibacteria bacterium]|nr:hypothetical protein [Candidatus Saccharibacteria bacterium]